MVVNKDINSMGGSIVSEETEDVGPQEGVEINSEEEMEVPPPKKGFLTGILEAIESRNPKLAKMLGDIRIQAFLLFLMLLIFYVSLVTWDFYFSSDSVAYGLVLKKWFEGKGVTKQDLWRPAHPLVTPVAILFTYPMLPFVGSNYLLSFAISNAILGSATVAIFYLFCFKIVGNRNYSLICSLGLAFSFAFWENCAMAEDKSLGFLLLTLYIPLLFAYVGELKLTKWYNVLKPWQVGFLTGIFMGLTLASHISFALLFLASLIIIWRYEGLKFLKSIKFIFFIFGVALICGIVFGLTAYALNVSNLDEFMGMFAIIHKPGSPYFVLSDPKNFSILIHFREIGGGIFTTLLMFISDEPIYKATIIGLGAFIVIVMAFIMISARNNKIVRSLYILMAIWFAHYFFFGPGDRNAWVYLLVPVWLSVCIGLKIIKTENIKLPFVKFKVSKKLGGYIIYMTGIVVVILLVNNFVVYANAHIKHDDRELFVHFAADHIDDSNAIMLVDEQMEFFFGYYSEVETVKILNVIFNPEVSDHINSSFENGSAIYIMEYWFSDSYVKVGTPWHATTYESRLKAHEEEIARFDAMYIHEPVYFYEWSDIYQITELNQTR